MRPTWKENLRYNDTRSHRISSTKRNRENKDIRTKTWKLIFYAFVLKCFYTCCLHRDYRVPTTNDGKINIAERKIKEGKKLHEWRDNCVFKRCRVIVFITFLLWAAAAFTCLSRLCLHLKQICMDANSLWFLGNF